MRGRKWNSVCDFVENMLGSLGEDDLVSALVFNEKVRLLQRIPQNDPLFTRQETHRQQIQMQIAIYRGPSRNPESSSEQE